METVPSMPNPRPRLSVIILNYNGLTWLPQCMETLRQQTILPQLEILLADNASTDGSDKLSEELVRGWPGARYLQHGKNLGYCEGNNRAALAAKGDYLLFLNNDTWLEADCLGNLLAGVEQARATAAVPLVLDYDNQDFQSMGPAGFDIFGLPSTRRRYSQTTDILMPEGCAYLIKRDEFFRLGGFDPELFMFADEWDLSWKVWISGGRAVAVPSARLHHRGAAQVNPKGRARVVELRTSDEKRYLANRNNLLVLMKNAKNVLLLLAVAQTFMLALETLVGWVLVRRWGFVKRTFFDALSDCWRRRHHIGLERRRVRGLRVRSDWWMLRFLRWEPNRWHEIKRMRPVGLPRVNPA